MTALAGPSTRTTDLAALLAARVPGRCLPAPFYIDPAIHDADVAGIFARRWIFVATEPEVPEPGDYVTVDVGPYSVIIVRDDDEQIRAWHNVCRHRGARILPEASGSVGNIVCGYHQWTYSPDGALLSAGEQPADFDKGCFGLKRVHLRNVAGLIHICLADEPPSDFDEIITRITPYLTPHQLPRTKVAAQIDLVEPGNWKLVMENNRECYHCSGGHPELLCSFFPTYGYDPDEMPARLQPAYDRFLQADLDLRRACDERGLPHSLIEELSGRPTGFRIQREPLDGAGESFSRDGTAVCRRLLADFDTARLGRLSMHLQPNAWFHLLSDHVVTFSVVPLAADQTLLRTTWLVHEDAVEGEDYDLEVLTDVWRATNEQDSHFVRLAQQGVSSPAFEPGPYAPSEYQVEEFCAWYVEQLKEYVSA